MRQKLKEYVLSKVLSSSEREALEFAREFSQLLNRPDERPSIGNDTKTAIASFFLSSAGKELQAQLRFDYQSILHSAVMDNSKPEIGRGAFMMMTRMFQLGVIDRESASESYVSEESQDDQDFKDFLNNQSL